MAKRTPRHKKSPKAAKWPTPSITRLAIGGRFRKVAAGCPQHIAQTSVHEAAHVFSAAFFRRPTKAVTLDDSDQGGSLWLLPAAGSAELVRETLVILAAGEVAERHWSRKHTGGSSDRDQMESAARRLVGLLAPQAAVDAEICEATRRAETLIQQRLKDVLEIACALLGFHAACSGVETGTLDSLDN